MTGKRPVKLPPAKVVREAVRREFNSSKLRARYTPLVPVRWSDVQGLVYGNGDPRQTASFGLCCALGNPSNVETFDA